MSNFTAPERLMSTMLMHQNRQARCGAWCLLSCICFSNEMSSISQQAYLLKSVIWRVNP
jgi:hypothetical protein